jgi:hypothetical protein
VKRIAEGGILLLVKRIAEGGILLLVKRIAEGGILLLVSCAESSLSNKIEKTYRLE